MAEGATIANAFVQIMPSMEGATDNITSAILPGIGQSGEKAGEKFGGMFTGKMGNMLKGVGVAALGYLGISTLTGAFMDVENGLNNVIKATGATGEAAESLKSVYLDVSRSVVGSFDDIGEAVGELNTRFGLTGDELEAASVQTMKFAKVTGKDAKTSIADITRLMNNAGISTDEYGNTLDKLTVASQKSGVDVSKLATTVTDNAASFKELGFSTDEAIAMLAQFEVSGANTSQILAGMKKGVAEWAKEGKSANEGFREFVDGVANGTVSMQDAIDIFGSRAGVSMYDAAQKGQLSFDDMYDAIVNNSAGALDSVYQDTLTAQEKFDLLGKNIQTGFYEIVEPIVDAVAPYMDEVIDAVAGAVRWFTDNAVPKIKEFIRLIGILIEGLVHTAGEFYNAAKDAVGFASNVASAIGNAVSNIVSWWSQLPGKIAGFVSDLASRVKAHFQGVLDFAMSIPERIVGFFTGIGARITGAIGSIYFPTPHVSWEPLEIAGMSTPINLPHVAWYAKGALFNDPSIIGVGEAGPEAVVPLTEPNIAPFADAVASRISSRSITVNNMTVVTPDPEDFMRQLTAFAARTRAQYA